MGPAAVSEARVILGLAACVAFLLPPLDGGRLEIAHDDHGVSALAIDELQFLPPEGRLGNLLLRYRVREEDWLELFTGLREGIVDQAGGNVVFRDEAFGSPLHVVQTFRQSERTLDWIVEIRNVATMKLTLGDLAFSIPWRRISGQDMSPGEIFERTFIKHQQIAGANSFVYFMKPNGEPPYLLATPHPGTSFEYHEGGATSAGAPPGGVDLYVLSAARQSEQRSGTWRMARTSLELRPGQRISRALRFQWCQSRADLRETLVREGLIHIEVVPGMTVPRDLSARFSLRTKGKIDAVLPEFPSETSLEAIGSGPAGERIYEVRFQRLGENLLTIVHDGGRRSIMEFFCTEPLEILIKKRARFLVARQQHRNPGVWYDGLFSVYDMRVARLRSPEDSDGFVGWWNYVITCDDSALGKPALLAQKNAIYPDPGEIEAVEYYIRNFVWGKLQRTDREFPYPYGVYGTPNWLVNRDPKYASQRDHRHLEGLHVWRGYDYCHVFAMYFHMYEIAQRFPEMTSYLPAADYLERAQQTARAYFRYPGEIFPWYEVYKWGHMNEVVVLDLIAALEKEGRQADADFLRAEWEKKVKYATYDDEYPFRSEFALDRTAFETSYALAKYGATTEMKPDENLWYDRNRKRSYSHPVVRREDSRAFMDRQLSANLSMRGWIEKAYYQYGADPRLTYMAAMGGEGILDYALNFAAEPAEFLRLGYASYLCSWALVNCGDAESKHGFWAPGARNDGAAGWEFVQEQVGRTFLRGRRFPRGAVPYDGEIDLGFSGALRMARTVVACDPIFGRIAFGGSLREDRAGSIQVIPRDGVRQRFAWVDGARIVQVDLEQDGFRADEPIEIFEEGREFRFDLENRAGKEHSIRIFVRVSEGSFDLSVDGLALGTAGRESEFSATLPASGCRLSMAVGAGR